MAQRHTFAQFLHDAGLAVWFGGTLAGAVAVNGAAADVSDPRERARVANAGWARWTPVNAAAIGCHLLGGAQLARARRGRAKHEQTLLGSNGTKLGLTAAALGATAYARVLGKKVQDDSDPAAVAQAQKQLSALQWALPALTGGILASSAAHDDRPTRADLVRGTVKGLPDSLGHAAASAAAATAAVVVPALKEARAAAAPVAKDAAERLSEAAKEARDVASPLAKDALDVVGPRVRDARDAVAPRVKDARDALAPKLRDARDAATPVLIDLRDAAAPKLKEARDAAGPKLKEARDAAGPKLREARDAAGPLLKDAREAAAPYAEAARANLSDAGHAIGKEAKHRFGKAKDALPVG
jgi:hypothetical protein